MLKGMVWTRLGSSLRFLLLGLMGEVKGGLPYCRVGVYQAQEVWLLFSVSGYACFCARWGLTECETPHNLGSTKRGRNQVSSLWKHDRELKPLLKGESPDSTGKVANNRLILLPSN